MIQSLGSGTRSRGNEHTQPDAQSIPCGDRMARLVGADQPWDLISRRRITGAGVREASLRAARAASEASDFAFGTSSRSSKVRVYLRERCSVTREMARVAAAPHLVNRCRSSIALRRSKPAPAFAIGVVLTTWSFPNGITNVFQQ